MQPSHLCSRLKDLVLISLSLIVGVYSVDFFLFPIFPNVQQHSAFAPSAPLGEPTLQVVDERLLRPASGPHAAGAEEEDSNVMYRNAPWKSGIGQWILKCGDAPTISVSERLLDNACKSNCSGRGVCNHDRAECRCFQGYSGEGCEKEEEFPCTIDELMWRVSGCGATCDTSKAFCYCGEGTKYPQRPVAEGCGFVSRDGVIDWNTTDPMIFNSSSGWCNVDPAEMTARGKAECHCTYDGTDGLFCDMHVESFCVNQCSRNGQCRAGFCACVEGWHGIDCSVPSTISSFTKLPDWLLPSRMDITSATMFDSYQQQNVQLTVERRRPLIYVYDLPSKFNIQFLEGRHYRFWCAIRTYDDSNSTVWTQNLYGTEPALLESLLASPHRTTNAEEADFFYVPTFEACARVQADSAPHTDIQKKYLGLRAYFSGDLQKQAYEHIKESYPYWNRSGGRDHIWLFAWDEGACSAPKEIWNSIMLVHWGNTNSKHNYSTSAYHADRWTNIPAEWRGNHPCYDPNKDVVLPAWKWPEANLIKLKPWARSREERPTLFYFNGNLGDMYQNGRPEELYSMGLRQKLGAEFGSLPNKIGELGRQSAPDVIVISVKTWAYELELSQSRFCGVFPGDGWSGRLEDSILHGCIPVIVQDGIHLPFEGVIDYSSFSVRIAEDELSQMVQILRKINDTMVDSLLAVVQSLWQRFTYHSVVKLEAQRQKLSGKPESEWASVYNTLVGDDAFATLIQVLHFKLCNSSWRDKLQEGATRKTKTQSYCRNEL